MHVLCLSKLILQIYCDVITEFCWVAEEGNLLTFLGNTGIIIGIWIIGNESFTTLEEMEITVLTQRRAEDPQTELMII